MLKRRNILKILGTGSLCLFLLGCREESFLVEQDSTVAEMEEVMVSPDVLTELEHVQASGESESANTEETEYPGQNEIHEVSDEMHEKEIVVHICGAVKQPGVYELKESQRLYEGIQKAGGFREDADEEYLNQAMCLEDGMKIVVPTQEETEKTSSDSDADFYVQKEEDSKNAAMEKEILQKNENADEKKGTEQKAKIDLNTADKAQLCTLPGIGESRAESIIAYREEHGFFQEPEDVMKVSGIKESAFEKIKDYVTVSR